MKKQTIKSLIAILIFYAAFLISAKAQIVYTDVIPDITKNTNGAVYSLDLNNDSTTDFDISIETGNSFGPPPCGSHSFAKIKIMPIAGNYVSTTSSSPMAMNLNTFINSTNIWSNGVLNMAYDSWVCIPCGWHCWHSVHGAGGQWLNTTDKYLGLKFTSGGNTYYAWAHLNSHVYSNGTATFTIKDYAYNSIPNQAILAGDTCATSPTVTITPSGPVKICQGDNVTLTANGTGIQYQWKKNGVNIIGAIQKTYVAKTAGTYNVIVTNSCGSNNSANSAIVTVGLPCKNSDASLSIASDDLEHLSVYPNPATNSVTIKIPSDDAGEIQIVNLFGRVVETYNCTSLRDETLQIDVTKFPAGMYVVRWRSGENYQAEKFSIVK